MRRRAECTSLSPAWYSASFPQASAHCFGVSLRARGCCGFGSAVRRSAALPAEEVLDGPVGAAQQQLRDGFGMAKARGNVQRRPSARQTAAGTRPPHSRRFAASGKAHPRGSRASTAALDAISNPTIRRLPWYAAQCSAVQPSLCTAVPWYAAMSSTVKPKQCMARPAGARGWAQRGYPRPHLYPNTKPAGSPRGSTAGFRFG